jgi:hypothetical protein
MKTQAGGNGSAASATPGTAPPAGSGTATSLERQTRALLELIEAERARQCAELLGEAGSRAAALRAAAHAEARSRVRQAFAEERARFADRVSAAEARLATQRRLHEQQRITALLQLAWEQLPGELIALWHQPDPRARWIEQVLASARGALRPGAWGIVHAPDWPAAERKRLAQVVTQDAGAAPHFEADAAIAAGLKIVAAGNVVDGTLDGLLADRIGLEARLLSGLEPGPS